MRPSPDQLMWMRQADVAVANANMPSYSLLLSTIEALQTVLEDSGTWGAATLRKRVQDHIDCTGVFQIFAPVPDSADL